ncbi:CDP-glucose 4,6-dehydratase [Shewanella xiamenensis]|nr:CDP-glucose 4,6-dehydratase [Shewanella xiamenensis]BDQ65380.1 CDP-glucose 4,6-dehydratase [Shewanella xiamenensis]
MLAMKASADFWSGKRVFLTGHTGFKGSWMSLMLTTLGAQVRGFSLEVMPKQLFDLAQIASVVEHRIGDINNAELIKKEIMEFKPDVIFHLAAQSLVATGYQDPLSTLDTNIMGTAKLLDSLKDWPLPLAVIVVSSDKCYQPSDGNYSFIESDRLGGFDPYSCSKAGCELVVNAYRASFFGNSPQIGIASVRAGNVIGGGDYAVNRIIPDTMAAIVRRKHVALRHPDAVRPWQHVLDALHGYLLLAEALYQQPQKYAEAWNFGPLAKDMLTVGELVQRCYQHMGMQYCFESQFSQFKETEILLLDSTKARESLQWQPHWSLNQTIEKILEWYLGVADGADVRLLTQAQIHHYMNSSLSETGACL